MFTLFSHKRTAERGMTVFEVLIATAIITVGMLALIQTFGVYVKFAVTKEKKVQATYLLEEGIEAASLLRDTGWSLNVNPISAATTSLYWNGTAWQISSTTNEYVDGGKFVRNIVFTPVYRDINGKIAVTGTPDSNTKFVTVVVSYATNSGTSTETLSKYLVNMYSN